MGLDRRLREHEALGDLGVRQPFTEGLEDLELARGEVGEARVVPAGRCLGRGGGAVLRELAGEHLEHAARDARGDGGVAARDGADRPDELAGLGVLEEEAARPGAQGGERVLVEVERREDDDARPGLGGDDPLRRLDAVRAGHAHVHEHDVRRERGRLRDARLAVPGLADDLDVVLGGEDHAEAHAQQGLVVDEQHPDRCPRSRHVRSRPSSRAPAWRPGSRSRRRLARTSQPVPLGPADTVPP